MLSVAVVLVASVGIAFSCSELQCNETSSSPHFRLTGYIFKQRRAETISACIRECDKEIMCRSINFKIIDLLCELNKADVNIAADKYIPAKGFVYANNPWPKVMRSCAQIHLLVPDAKSGYYWIHVKDKQIEVYCDMITYGGGWTLVASISHSSNNHLQRAEVNCYRQTRCVEFTTSTVPCRKLSDEDIHEIATIEGTFRVDQVTDGVTGFYQIPAGANKFNSECQGHSCPRIITSHVHPYKWESNCKGTQIGYLIKDANCHRVFDMRDTGECGEHSDWVSSKFSTHRVLYGYPCHSAGIHRYKDGFLFVK